MLIVEGTDCVGKTTLAQKLVRELASDGYVYAHFTRLPEGFDYCGNYISRASRRIVQDRYHMSQWAYCVARKEPMDEKLTAEKYRIVDAHLRMLGGYTVIVMAHESLIRRRFQELHGREMYDVEQILEAQRAFEFVITTRAVDYDVIIRCDMDKPYPTGEDVEKILANYRRRQSEQQKIAEGRAYSFERVV
jgi:thymidylate kinase